MARVLAALGATDINVFVINSCIMFSVKTEEGSIVSDIRRCTEKSTDLYKIEKLNSLCRKICGGFHDYEEIIKELDRIESKKSYPFLLKLFGFIIISAGFAVIFGGALWEAIAAAFTGLLVYPLVYFMDNYKTGLFFKNIIGSAAIVLFVILFSAFIHPISIDEAIIGTFMNLVPGVALSTSMRDIIAGDLISGKNVLTEAIIVALGIALGAGLAMSGLQFLV